MRRDRCSKNPKQGLHVASSCRPSSSVQVRTDRELGLPPWSQFLCRLSSSTIVMLARIDTFVLLRERQRTGSFAFARGCERTFFARKSPRAPTHSRIPIGHCDSSRICAIELGGSIPCVSALELLSVDETNVIPTQNYMCISTERSPYSCACRKELGSS